LVLIFLLLKEDWVCGLGLGVLQKGREEKSVVSVYCSFCTFSRMNSNILFGGRLINLDQGLQQLLADGKKLGGAICLR